MRYYSIKIQISIWCDVIVSFLRLVYRYLYKYFFAMLFVLSIFIIMVIWKSLIQNTLNRNNKHFNKAIFFIRSNDFYYSDDCVKNKKKISYKSYDNFLLYSICLYNKKLSQDFCTISNISEKNNIFNTRLKVLDSGFYDVNRSGIMVVIKQSLALKNRYIDQILFWWIVTIKKIMSFLMIANCSDRNIDIFLKNIDTSFVKGVIKFLNLLGNEITPAILFIGELRNGTFIEGARSLGIKEKYIKDVVNALQYQLDFRKLHKGDRFAILISVILQNNHIVDGKLIGARLYTSGKNYYIFRANNGQFYDREAMRLGQNFIRFPIGRAFRISSNFNLNRLNPVTGKVSPHAGVDFAVPVGTPICSVGDGEVIVSKYSKIAGNYIAIKHGCFCVTRYMHLKKVLVYSGQKVIRGEKIALSGNTGRSTGPHLHFEMWINHRPVNPLTFNIVNVEKLLGSERLIFLEQIKKISSVLHFD
ncbi:murein DD-endopeptidase MepM [Candidatus Blochmannia ocreatus (nom. nud.)]|uniref:Murein DD-endopeptidase MepM n=1 Tax=Candidatus Blochmannia ocreatus (nom. nud.) TaxID=251538 RepID=A0ABY4SSI8_9ENTR|nr:murein DD-endopeptidase MepM [Candidatus Blochmannia ocreatus]URJ24950.1 murein DD-endopeptidase MepM [Candidatus Blochmannia ocreatus]